MMKILYVTTVSSTMSFFTEHIKMLLQGGHVVDFACNVMKPINSELVMLGCEVHDVSLNRSPFSVDNWRGYKQLKGLLRKKETDVVHTHTPIVSALVRVALRKDNHIKIIYTAHGFHFHKGAPLLNWLLFYPVEKWLSRYTDVLITINKEDYERAKKSFKAGRIEYVPGVGVNVEKCSKVTIKRKEKRTDLGLAEDDFVLVSTGELNSNKNHKTAIHAIHKLNNPSVKYLICGQGQLEDELLHLVKDLDLEHQVMLLGFRTDILEINHIADVFVFPSFREGLSVALMEAMACGLPVVCSDIRGNRDLVEDGKGGFLVGPRDVVGFAQSIKSLSENAALRKRMGQNNVVRVRDFDTSIVLSHMMDIYKTVSKRTDVF